ncbi:MAG: hypothetical protein WCT12_34705 [Verrucomicrobiota bacterium]
MKTNELLKKLGHKLLGKKTITSTAGDLVSKEKPMKIAWVHDGLGIIALHEHWRN